MRITVSTAVTCAREAFQDFRVYEYLPFGFILAAQLLFLFLTLNLGTAWGMGTAGWLAGGLGGEHVTHYPGFFLFLPNLMSGVEAFLYTVPGSVLIPLAVVRILEPAEPGLRSPGAAVARVKRAVLPVLATAIASAGLLAGWQFILPKGPGTLVRSLSGGGTMGDSAYWLVGVLGAYAVSACFLCVPIEAVRAERGFVETIVKGVKRSLAVLPFTYVYAVLFSAPALFVLYLSQVFGSHLVRQMRPETSAVLIGVYVVLINLGSYILYAAATRLVIASRSEAA